MAHDSPAMRRACTYLVAEAERRRGTDALRLPPIPVLANQAGVSQATIAKAVRRLCQQGLLVTSHGKGTRVLPHPRYMPSESPPGQSAHKWQRCARRLEHDFVLHSRGQDRIPALKELCARYGVCERTMRKALDSLEHRGSLRRQCRSYFVRVHRADRTRNTIVLIARGEPSGRSLLYATPRTQDHLRHLEHECGRRGIALKILTCNRFGRRLDDLAKPAFALPATIHPDMVLGFLVWCDAIDPTPLEELFRGVCRFDKPIGLLDDDGERVSRPSVRGLLRAGRSACVYRTTPGRQVGSYLLSRGHRAVAYITAGETQPWSVLRRQGLVQAFEQGGLERGVRQFGLSDEELHDRSLSAALEHARRLNPQLPRSMMIPRVDYPSLSLHQARFVQELHAYAERADLIRRMTPVYRRAQRWQEATAWVCASDTVALSALEYLRSQVVGVPRQVSVIGMDDTAEASAARLTSYNFGSAAAVSWMVERLFRPRTRGGSRNDDIFEPEGYVSERGTVGSVPREV
ncbi:MAG: GntR family transcriptional regulator [Chitinivibrionales bacterium]|nr:GntR family transcriptional regulator [Chitinivibrionales bacterium]